MASVSTEITHRAAICMAGVMPTATAIFPLGRTSSGAAPVPIVIPIEGESKAVDCPKVHAVR